MSERARAELIERLIVGIVIVVIVGLLGWCIVGPLTDLTEISKEQGEKTVSYTVNLRSINYASDVQGRFVLGCGRVGEVDYYVCYEELEDGGITLLKLDVDETIIYETLEAGEKAYAEIVKNGWGLIESIKLYVPEGTVQVQYDLSLDE